jgi:hypothetical protein
MGLNDKLSLYFLIVELLYVDYQIFISFKLPRTSPCPLQRGTCTNGKSPFEGGRGMFLVGKTRSICLKTTIEPSTINQRLSQNYIIFSIKKRVKIPVL